MPCKNFSKNPANFFNMTNRYKYMYMYFDHFEWWCFIGPAVVNNKELELYMNALAAKHPKVLPPLNWATILTPFLKLPFGNSDILSNCILC